MDTWKFYDITHRRHVVCNPTSEEKLTRLVDLVQLPTAARVVDIACGKGEFLLLLCESGRNNGVGYDPGYRADRHAPAPGENVRFVADFYTADTRENADFVCCKMTLEHIAPTADFVETVRRSVGDDAGRAVQRSRRARRWW